ncbi:C40 family peptidase [Polaribacter pacificus]|nr:C40 family peptidase [Polaribacter pacificus]
MRYGICNLSIVSLRLEPAHQSEMLSQVLFGEHFKVLEQRKDWSKVRLFSDGYEGFIDNKQYVEITEELYTKLTSETPCVTGELIDFICGENNQLITIPIGSQLPLFDGSHCYIQSDAYSYDGLSYNSPLPKDELIQKSFQFLNSPYLWGGKTPFGMDCSGFTQLVYKLCGYNLLREAKQQATQGEVLSFIEESEPGDLAFFDNQEGVITHVGIIMKDNYIIHAYGKVRIDRLDHSGIYNADIKRHTHKLRVIKKII